jgi:hypothetical protein
MDFNKDERLQDAELGGSIKSEVTQQPSKLGLDSRTKQTETKNSKSGRPRTKGKKRKENRALTGLIKSLHHQIA